MISDTKSSLAASALGLGSAFLAATDISEFLDVWLSNKTLDGEAAKTFANYYSSYTRSFSPRMRRLYTRQICEAERVLERAPTASILEVGCGLGTESLWLALKGGDVQAVDVRQDRIDAAKARQRVLETEIGHPLTCAFSCGSFLKLEDEESFDLIWMEQAFHHLEPRQDVVKRTARLLKPGGYLVISEANALNPLLQLELFIRRGVPRVTTHQGPDGTCHAYGVERITSAIVLARTFERVGIRRISVCHYRMFPNSLVFDRFAGIEEILARNALAPLLTHFNYVGQKTA